MPERVVKIANEVTSITADKLRRIDRVASFWRRLRKAVFVSPTKLKLEVDDRARPTRRYTGTLELKNYEWRLTELAIVGL